MKRSFVCMHFRWVVNFIVFTNMPVTWLFLYIWSIYEFHKVNNAVLWYIVHVIINENGRISFFVFTKYVVAIVYSYNLWHKQKIMSKLYKCDSRSYKAFLSSLLYLNICLHYYMYIKTHNIDNYVQRITNCFFFTQKQFSAF